MRKSSYIVKLNHKDEQFCYVLKNAQHVTREQALAMITRGRLDNYQKEGIVRTIRYLESNQPKTAIELTQKGRAFIHRHYPEWSRYFYTSSTSPAHNIMLASKVMERGESRDWLNERDLRHMLMERIADAGELRQHYMQQLERGELSVPDGAHYERGELICEEIINDHYGTAEIAAKEACAEILGGSVEFTRQ